MIAKLVIFLWAYYSNEAETTQGWQKEISNYTVGYVKIKIVQNTLPEIYNHIG